MKFDEMLKACSIGVMPMVEHEKLGVGRVTVIKSKADGSTFVGCAVRFNGYNFDLWFHDSDGQDKRSRYMYELKLFNP